MTATGGAAGDGGTELQRARERLRAARDAEQTAVVAAARARRLADAVGALQGQERKLAEAAAFVDAELGRWSVRRLRKQRRTELEEGRRAVTAERDDVAARLRTAERETAGVEAELAAARRMAADEDAAAAQVRAALATADPEAHRTVLDRTAEIDAVLAG